MSEVAVGGTCRSKIPMLGPNPFDIDFMDGNPRNAEIRLEFTLKRLTDIILIIMKYVLKSHSCATDEM